VELIVRVLACLAEGLGIRATARVFEVDPDTVLQWLVAAAEQLQAFTSYFLCDMHVTQLQLDELYAVIRALKTGEISEDDALKRLSRAGCRCLGYSMRRSSSSTGASAWSGCNTAWCSAR